jgi:hypothetical protein
MSNQARTRKVEEKNRVPLKVIFLVLGVLVVIALMADLAWMSKPARPVLYDVPTDLQNLVLNLHGERYVHPDGRFSIVKPAGWRMKVRPESHPYDVVFYGPNATDISIMATPVKYNTLPELMKDLEQSERESGLAMNKDPFFFKGAPAVKRLARLRTTSVLALDFVRNNVAYHVICGVPPEYFEQYEPVLMDVLNTWEFGDPSTGRPEE